MTTTQTPTAERSAASLGIIPYPGPPPRRPPADPPPVARHGASRARAAMPLVAGLLAIAALVPAQELWPAQLALLGLLLVVPGLALLHAVRVPRLATAATPVYVPAASLAVLLAAGLGVNLIGPEIGVEAPLRTIPLLIGVEALCAALLIAAAIPRPPRRDPRVRIAVPRLRHLWPLLLPLASAAGAARLTNGDGDIVAVVAVTAAVVILVAATIAGSRLDTLQLALILYSIGLALAWSFSLRSGTVYGFDVSGELPILNATHEAGIWHLSHPSDAYGAMLSLTVLPSLLQSLTGLSALVLLKAVYPAIFALFPVTVFLLARRHLSARFAFAGAAFIIVQANFAQQIPAVARQEIGLVAFAVLVAAALDRRLPRGPRWALVTSLGLALVVSHYSSAYLAIALFAAAVVLQALVSLVRPVPRVTGALVVALLVVAGGGALWYGPLTHSASNLARVTDSVRTDGLQLLPNRRPGEGILQGYLTGNLPSHVSAAEYAALAKSDYAKNRDFIVPLPDAGAARYALRDAATPDPPLRSETAKSVLDRAQLWILQLANLLAVVGALVLAVRRRTRPGLRVVALLALGTLSALAFVRLSGTISENYNQDRALIQALVPLAVVLAWVAQSATRVARRLGPLVVVVVALALGAVALNTSGLAGAAQNRPVTNLANHGEDYERYYVTRPELASADWLRAARYGGGLLYTDRYGQLRTISEGIPTQAVLLDVTPATLDRHAWIYASAVNTLDGRARGVTGNHYATYRFPDRFIADHWNTVYANGSSAVYHR